MEKFISIPVTSAGNIRVGVTGARLVLQASTTTVTISYGASSTATDVVTITHAALGAGVYTMRDVVMNAILLANKAASNPDAEVVVEPTAAVSAIAIA